MLISSRRKQRQSPSSGLGSVAARHWARSSEGRASGAELSRDRVLYRSCCQKCSRQVNMQRKGDPIPARLPPGRADPLFPGLGPVQLGLEVSLHGWRAPDGGLPGKCLPGARLVPESVSHEQSNPIKPLSTARPGRLPGAAPKGHSLLSSVRTGCQ